jgi:hypothetical protein
MKAGESTQTYQRRINRVIDHVKDQSTDDTLKVCYDMGGKNRPTEFKTKPATQLFLVTYKREKP